MHVLLEDDKVQLAADGSGFRLTLKYPSFDDKTITSILSALDLVESNVGDMSPILTTTGVGKYYHLGLDLAFFRKLAPENAARFINQSYAGLIRRLLTLPCVTVAAINGHCYAAGLAFACAHDYRFSTSAENKKLYLCMNEIDMHVPVPRVMYRLVAGVLADHQAEREVLAFGKKMLIEESFNLIDANKPLEPKHGAVLALIRAERMAPVLKVIEQDWNLTESPFRFVRARL